MQSAEEFEYSIEKCFERESDGCFTRDDPRGDAAKLISARDAEWQARVDKLETTIKLQENMLRIYNEEFTKQGHRLFLVQARVEKLEAALSEARLTVGGIFTANYKDWDEGLNTPEEYILWSKSRSGDLLRKLDAALGREA